MKKTAALFVLLLALLSFGSLFGQALGSMDPAKVNVLANGKAQWVTVLSFNDFHGTLAEDTSKTGKNPGMAKLVGYVKSLKNLDPNTIVVSGGDLYQGSALSNLTMGAPVSDMCQLLDVKASALGNHEFDWGAEKVTAWSKMGGFPFLAANIIDKKTAKPVDFAYPYLIVNVGGHKIAFIGLATMETVSKAKVEFVSPYDFQEPAVAAQKWVDYLNAGKAPEGKPEVIIALTHLPSAPGKEAGTAVSMALLNELDNLSLVQGLDAIITAHSHNTVAGLLNGKPVVQGYYNGRTLGALAIKFYDDGTFAIAPSVDEFYKFKDKIAADADAAAVYAMYGKDLNPILGEVLGTATAEIPHSQGGLPNVTPMGYWSADVMRKKGNVQIGIQNGGGLRRGLNAGTITMGDLYEIMPFDNTLVTFEITGAELKKAIDHGLDAPDMGSGQFAGVIATYDPTKPYESRLVSLTLEDGTPIVDTAYYSVATNDFQFGGGDKYVFKTARNARDTYIPIRDLLVETIKAAKTLSPANVQVVKSVK
jgi:2',3'-cyclic-nucleotide 2'-phosphodiesterase (5'-nucleotidase family)